MKKILSALAICLVLALCLGLAIAEGQSDTGYDGWSYEWPTRTHDGQLEDIILERCVAPTCTTNGLAVYQCTWDPTLFHEVVIYAYGHNFARVEPLTCTTSRYYCTNDGCTAYEDRPADNHKWSSEDPDNQYNWGKITKEPTCTEKGEAIDYCYVCGLEREKVRIIDEIGHQWKMVLDYKPFCVPDPEDEMIEEGMYHWECSVCGTPETYDGETVVYEYVDLEAYHNLFGDAGYDGHDWDGYIIERAPSCKYEGKGVRFCKRCGEKQINEHVPTTAHNFVEKKTLRDCYTADFTCTCVNEVINPETGEKEICGEPDPTYVERLNEPVVAHQFVYTDEYIFDELEPTCTTPGYITYKCIFYDDNPEHAEYADDYQAGLETVDVPALGHQWGEWVLRYQIGEGDNDYAYYVRTCTRVIGQDPDTGDDILCNATEERVTLYETPEPCADDEHEWTATGFILPTCEEDGIVTYKCFKCGVEDAEITPATGHDFEEELVKAATCTENGKILKTCKVCGYIETEEIEAEGHKWVDQGDGTEKCSVCGELKGDAWKEGFVVEDGVWKWYVHDVWQEDLTAIVTFDGAEFWVVKGVLPLDANGLINCPDGKFYFLSQGKIVRNSGFVEYLGQWFKIVNGELDLSYNGLFDYDGGKFLVAAGRWIQTVSGLWQNLDSKWYYLADGQVVAYSGVAEYNGRFFVVANGVLDTSYNGTIQYDGHTFEVADGQLAVVPID